MKSISKIDSPVSLLQNYCLQILKSTKRRSLKCVYVVLRFFQRGCFSFLNNIFGRSKLNVKRSFKLKNFQKRRRAVVTWNDKCTCQVPPELIMGEYMMAHQARVWLSQRKNAISIKFQMKIFVKRIILLSTKKRWTCFVVNIILWVVVYIWKNTCMLK